MPRKKASAPKSPTLASLIAQAEQRIEAIAKQRVEEVRTLIEAILARTGMSLAEVFPKGMAVAKAAVDAAINEATKTKAAKPKAEKAEEATPTKGPRKGFKRPAKYRDPADETRTWSGGGSRPKWLTEALASGATLESFLVAGASPVKGKASRKNSTAKSAPAKKVGRANKPSKAK